MSGKSPKWWANPEFVDPTQLCGNPDYLDQIKERIDKWVNSVRPNEITKRDKPFVMENRFDVILKEDFHGMLSGTTGTIVVKDDFKSISVVFIGRDGEKTALNEPTERLLQVFEVVTPDNNEES